MNPGRNLCSFWLMDMYFGIEVLTVQEVIRHHDLTPVPLASEVVSGLMNLRGQIITVIDLRRRMELPARETDDRPMHLVVHGESGPVSFAVDRIGDVVYVPESAYEPPPGNLTGAARELICGAHKLDDALLLELDTYRLLNDLAHAGTAPERRSA